VKKNGWLGAGSRRQQKTPSFDNRKKNAQPVPKKRRPTSSPVAYSHKSSPRFRPRSSTARSQGATSGRRRASPSYSQSTPARQSQYSESRLTYSKRLDSSPTTQPRSSLQSMKGISISNSRPNTAPHSRRSSESLAADLLHMVFPHSRKRGVPSRVTEQDKAMAIFTGTYDEHCKTVDRKPRNVARVKRMGSRNNREGKQEEDGRKCRREGKENDGRKWRREGKENDGRKWRREGKEEEEEEDGRRRSKTEPKQEEEDERRSRSEPQHDNVPEAVTDEHSAKWHDLQEARLRDEKHRMKKQFEEAMIGINVESVGQNVDELTRIFQESLACYTKVCEPMVKKRKSLESK